MPRMPGAIWRPLADNWASMPRITSWDIFCLHTMVGSLDGTDGYFRSGNGSGYGGTESHFGVGHDGTIYQWQDTAFQADANWRGGYRVISSENADTGTGFPKWGGSDVPAFTDPQVEANAEIAAWLYDEHGIPLDLIPDSKPGRRGMGWHRQGVPGYVVSGGELWSKSAGKVCPGDRRIAQIPTISARAKQIAAGVPATPAIDPRGPEMRVLQTTDTGRIYKATDLEVVWVKDPAIAASTQKGWGKAELVTQRDIDVMAFDANASRARQRAEIVAAVVAQVTGNDIDENALGRVVVTGLLPELTAALAEKTGATREDVEQIVRGVFGDAAAAA